jgi:hypothetical protein
MVGRKSSSMATCENTVERPRLRIHHLLAWTAIVAALLLFQSVSISTWNNARPHAELAQLAPAIWVTASRIISKLNAWIATLIPRLTVCVDKRAILYAMSTAAFHYETFSGFSPFSDVGPYRAADYWQLPEGAPVELIKGRFVVSPSPNVLHQIVVGTLFEILLVSARKSGGTVLLSPMDVIYRTTRFCNPTCYTSRKRGVRLSKSESRVRRIW